MSADSQVHGREAALRAGVLALGLLLDDGQIGVDIGIADGA